nr:hypothetical protein [Micromonospora sp. R77]
MRWPLRATGHIRGVSARCRADARTAAPAVVELAEVAAGLPVRCGPAVPSPPPHPDQPRPLAGPGGAVSDDEPVHLRGRDGMCVGRRARLVPYPCRQVEWVTGQRARAAAARFPGVRG